MKIPLTVLLKDFFGFYVVTPFEADLLKRLRENLSSAEKEIFDFQFTKFTTVRRLIKHINIRGAHGFTSFYTTKFGKDTSEKQQTKRFLSNQSESVLATTNVVFDQGKMEVKFFLVRGVFFRIEYKSPQKIYYPSGKYDIEEFNMWPM